MSTGLYLVFYSVNLNLSFVIVFLLTFLNKKISAFLFTNLFLGNRIDDAGARNFLPVLRKSLGLTVLKMGMLLLM